MDTFWGHSATYWTGIYALIAGGLLFVAVVAAFYAWRQWRATREQVEDARKAAVEANRPYILVTAEPSDASWRLFDLSVRNIGRRPAMDVSVHLDPPPKSSIAVAGHEIAEIKMLNEPIAMIAPGQEMRLFWDSHPDRLGVKGLPTSHQVTLSYKDTSGHLYNERSAIDLEAMRGATFAPPKSIQDIANALEEIQKILGNASVLNREGNLDVGAVVESWHEHEDREDREGYERAKANLAMLASRSTSRPDLAGYMDRLESEVGEWEARHPEDAVASRGSGRSRTRVRPRAEARAFGPEGQGKLGRLRWERVRSWWRRF